MTEVYKKKKVKSFLYGRETGNEYFKSYDEKILQRQKH